MADETDFSIFSYSSVPKVEYLVYTGCQEVLIFFDDIFIAHKSRSVLSFDPLMRSL